MHRIFMVEWDNFRDIDKHIENNEQGWHIKSVHPVASQGGDVFAYVVLTSEDDYFPLND